MQVIAFVLGCAEEDPEGVPPARAGVEGLPPDPPQAGGLPPNLLLVVLDDVGLDKIVGPTAARTPTIDALRAEGTWFPQAWGAVYCGPARIQLLTGRWSRRYGFGENPDSHGTYAVPERERYLPALLAEAPVPYASVAIGKWGVRDGAVPDAMRDPLDRGFLHHVGTAHNLQSYYDWKAFRDGVAEDRTDYATSAVVDDALDALEALPEPWFLYLAPNADHTPLEPPPPDLNFAGVTADDPAPVRGDAVLSALDAELGRLLDALPDVVRARTVVVLVGDNGSYGPTTRPPYDPTHAKGTTYEGGLRVPLVVSGPGVARGEVSERLVDLPDVTATLLELAGVDLATAGSDGGPWTLDGTSLGPQLADPDAPGPAYAWSEYLGSGNGPPPWEREQVAIRDARFKLVSTVASEALYELSGPLLSDGPDLLADALEPEAEEALERLRAERDRIRAEAPYAP